jgi:hypothetical protein
MALGGGMILVRVDRDRPQLSGRSPWRFRERVENIARDVDHPVTCQVALLRKDPPVTGYLVITVPISHDAPHAHQSRFYRRFGSISAPLKHPPHRRCHETP